MAPYRTLLLVLTVVLVWGCGKAPVLPPPTVPARAKDAVNTDLRQLLAPLSAGPVSDETRAQVVAAVTAARAQLQGNGSGQDALFQAANDTADIIAKARDENRWRVVLAGIEVYAVLMPDDPKWTELKKRATMYCSRPKVELKGFFDDKERGSLYAFLQMTMRMTGEKFTAQIRKGEEAYGVRLVDIVGNGQGVLLEYMDTPGERFKLMLP